MIKMYYGRTNSQLLLIRKIFIFFQCHYAKTSIRERQGKPDDFSYLVPNSKLASRNAKQIINITHGGLSELRNDSEMLEY